MQKIIVVSLGGGSEHHFEFPSLFSPQKRGRDPLLSPGTSTGVSSLLAYAIFASALGSGENTYSLS